MYIHWLVRLVGIVIIVIEFVYVWLFVCSDNFSLHWKVVVCVCLKAVFRTWTMFSNVQIRWIDMFSFERALQDCVMSNVRCNYCAMVVQYVDVYFVSDHFWSVRKWIVTPICGERTLGVRLQWKQCSTWRCRCTF